MGVFSAACLALALGAGPDPGGPTGPGRPRPGGELGAEDARYLDWIVKDFLFDPRGAVRVRVRVSVPATGLKNFTMDQDGWLVRGANGPVRLHLADGEAIPVPATGVRELDFEALCARKYPAVRWQPDPATTEEEVSPSASARTGGAALADAAWLHRRGYDRLAARALAAARAAGPDPGDELREELAGRLSAAVCDAFARRADAEAAAHGERLRRLGPDRVPPTTAAVLADLDRRRKACTFGKPAPPWPAGFAAWDDRRKAAHLIATLDEIGPGPADGSDVTDHPRFRALVELGDAAVPGLLDAMEHDRLTRHLVVLQSNSGRRAAVPDEMLPVREVADQAVRHILRVSNLEPRLVAEADEQSGPGYLARVRRYWATYGHLGFEERMLAVLTDPDARSDARAEAAENLAAHVPCGRGSWARPDGPDHPTPPPARPRVADAVLAALDAERGREGRRRRPSYVERVYLKALTELRDPRLGPKLARRARDETAVGARVAYALAAHRLGAPGPLVGLARELAAGTLTLPPRRGPVRPDRTVPTAVADLIEGLRLSELPEADGALDALTDPAHPYFPLLLNDLLSAARPDELPWAHDPFCVGLLRAALTDLRPTGWHYYLRGDEVEVSAGRKVTRHPLPPGAAGWREHAEERVADRAAARLAELVAGVPEPSPLSPDADRVLAGVRAVALGHEFDSLDPADRARLGGWRFDLGYRPLMHPLGRPATAADVRAGRAVFELAGGGRVPDGPPPDWVLLKATAGGEPQWGMVEQVEVGPDGRLVYGVVFRHAIRAVKAAEVERVASAER